MMPVPLHPSFYDRGHSPNSLATPNASQGWAESNIMGNVVPWKQNEKWWQLLLTREHNHLKEKPYSALANCCQVGIEAP